MIKGISGQLPERWKLKVGAKGAPRKSKDGGTYRIPTKWDHIKICTIERDENDDFIIDEELTEKMGGSPEPKAIGPIILLYDNPDINLWTAYRAYRGRTCMCRGDGETAKRVVDDKGTMEDVECPCPRLEEGKCKPNGILSFVIPEAELGGVCKFRTTSWNSIRSLLGGMAYFRQITGGRLRGIPFYLRLNEKETQVKGQSKPQKIYFLSIEYQGNLGDIRQHAIEHAQSEAKQLVLVENIEADARKQLAKEAVIEEHDDEDAVEFYPSAEEKEDGSVVDKETGDLIQAPPVETKTPKFPLRGEPADEPIDDGPEGPEEAEAPEEAEEEAPETKVPTQGELLI